MYENCAANILCSVTLIILLTQIPMMQENDISWFFVSSLLMFVMWLAWTCFQTYMQFKNKYDHKKLFSDIESLDMEGHPFDLLVIQNKNKSKVLTVFDKRLQMNLFPYKRMTYTDSGSRVDEKEEEDLKNYLADIFQVDVEAISIATALRRYVEKYSVSDKTNKNYDMRYLVVSIEGISEVDEFVVNGHNYKWMYMSDLEVDPLTVKNNSEVFAIVKNEVL